jgi:hypothetical protein
MSSVFGPNGEEEKGALTLVVSFKMMRFDVLFNARRNEGALSWNRESASK